MKIEFRGLWKRLRKWWRGYDVVRFHFRSGNIVEMRVTHWKFTRSSNPTGGVGGYEITYHPSNKHQVILSQLDQIECVVEVN